MTEAYRQKLRALSHRLVELQRPVRILNSIRIPAAWTEGFRASGFKDLPKDARAHYASIPLGFDPEAKTAELKALRDDITLHLGDADELGRHLVKLCDQYAGVVAMLSARGERGFYDRSRELYGSPKDCLAQDRNTISEMSRVLYPILEGLRKSVGDVDDPEDWDSAQVVDELNQRFDRYFGSAKVVAKLSDGIVADAAAGGDKVKINTHARFSLREVDIYEVHEGWVHVGTTLNGRAQATCDFLSVGPPRCASTQEGLAVLMEIFTFRSFVRRAQLINDRVVAIEKAEDGANLIEVFEFLRTQGYPERECLTHAFRVFRGGTLTGGAPFTKDISYCKGFVENYNFLRSCIRAGRAELIPFLFCGKLHADDVPLLYAKSKEGLVAAPTHLPPQFRDLNGLAVWMGFSSFFNRVDLTTVQAHYKSLFDKFL